MDYQEGQSFVPRSFWDRITLKSRAKNVLRATYWTCFLVSLVAGILSGGETPRFRTNINLNNTSFRMNDILPDELTRLFKISEFPFFAFGIGFSVVMLALAVAIAFYVFVGGPIEVGSARFFSLNSKRPAIFKTLFSGFNSNEYLKNVKTMFLKTLYVFLWSLLLIVPGIIKYYEYKMVRYIIAENPNIETNRALEISRRMTYGEKWEMFVLDLSFIGWYLLGALAAALTCGIGALSFLFLTPYVHATEAELYGALRQKAVRIRACGPLEIGAELFERYGEQPQG
ncbi:MAG: hypothetical protein K0R90_462 [Oscillospiraceae bacterium]|jgi:uncharacterized membrane protein|nr:hypothetical protein [Oscillospiraceae bacterium]